MFDLVYYPENRIYVLTLLQKKTKVGTLTFSVNANKCDFWTIAVKEKYRGNGYGRELFDYMISYLWERNVNKLKLTVLGGEENLQMMSLISNFEVITANHNNYLLQI